MSTTATKSNRTQKSAVKRTQTSQSTQGTMQSALTREQIAARAFEIYMRSGCRPGQDEQNWLQAEKELRAEASKVTI
jgi:hypothetical protein